MEILRRQPLTQAIVGEIADISERVRHLRQSFVQVPRIGGCRKCPGDVLDDGRKIAVCVFAVVLYFAVCVCSRNRPSIIGIAGRTDRIRALEDALQTVVGVRSEELRG